MLRILDSSTTPTIVLDGSGISDWLRCHRYYAYRHHTQGGGVVPAEDSIELVAGGAVHAALEVRYRLARGGPVSDEVRQAMRSAVDAKFTSSVCTPDWRTADYVWTLLEAYLLEYPTEPFSPREIEAPFARALGTVQVAGRQWGVIYQGRRDLTVAFTGTQGQEWVVDHKTASSDSNFLMAWGQSLSQRGYVWSRQQLTGRPVEGYYMNILGWRKPTVKASTLPRFFFQRVPIAVAQWELEEWRESILTYALEIIRGVTTGVWAKSGRCGEYGRKCSFWDVCSSPTHTRDRLLASGTYRANSWSPLQEG